MYLNIASISRCRMANHSFCLLKLVIYNKQYIYRYTYTHTVYNHWFDMCFNPFFRVQAEFLSQVTPLKTALFSHAFTSSATLRSISHLGDVAQILVLWTTRFWSVLNVLLWPLHENLPPKFGRDLKQKERTCSTATWGQGVWCKVLAETLLGPSRTALRHRSEKYTSARHGFTQPAQDQD